MKERFRRWLRELRRPGVALAALLLTALIGFGVYTAVRFYRAESYYRAAQRALARLDFVEARADLRLCLEIGGEDPDVRLLLAKTARRAGNYEEADQQLENYEKLPGSIREEVDLERLLQLAQRGSLGSVEKPLHYFVIHKHPHKVLILEALTQGYLQTYRLPQALQCVKLWLAEEPDNALALYWRGHIYELLQSHTEALADYRRVVELDPGHQVARLALANLLVLGSQPQEALHHYELLLENDSGNPVKLVGLARCRVALGQTAQARKELDLVLRRYPKNVLALYLRGKLEFDARDPGAAEPWLKKAVTLAPFDPLAVYHYHLCLKQLKREKEAAPWLKRFNDIDTAKKKLAGLTKKMVNDPTNPDLRFEAGKIFLDTQQDGQGLRWMASALQEDPNHRPTRQYLANYFRKIGKPELAAEQQQILDRLGAPGRSRGIKGAGEQGKSPG
jgi:tetratricopeptide (TPR) repeat protein